MLLVVPGGYRLFGEGQAHARQATMGNQTGQGGTTIFGGRLQMVVPGATDGKVQPPPPPPEGTKGAAGGYCLCLRPVGAPQVFALCFHYVL